MAHAVIQSRSQFSGKRIAAGWALHRLLLWVQGSYYLLTGIWPLVSIRTFQMVTGPKTDHLPTGREADHWLVMTAGVLITSIAVPLVISAWRGRAPGEVIALAISAAIGLTCIDVIYVARGVIAPIYLLDAAIQVPLVAAWLAGVAMQLASKREARRQRR